MVFWEVPSAMALLAIMVRFVPGLVTSGVPPSKTPVSAAAVLSPNGNAAVCRGNPTADSFGLSKKLERILLQYFVFRA